MTVLAEALAERKDLVARIGRFDDELAAALVIEEGDSEEAAHKTAKVLDEALHEALDKLQEIENRIREANTRVSIVFDHETLTISQAIVLRDRLKTEQAALSTVASALEEATGHKADRWGGRRFERRNKEEVRLVAVVDPIVYRAQADATAKRLRLLDIEIQKANWSAEI